MIEAHIEHRDPQDSIARYLAMFLRMALMAGATLAIIWPLTPNSGRISGVCAAILGVWLGETIGRSRLRLWPLVILPLPLLVLLWFIAQMWVNSDWPSALFDSEGALVIAEILRWGGSSLIVIAALRGLARRKAALNVIELMLPLLAAASMLSSHRGGQLHRPQILADWAVEQGQDPTWYLLLIGIGGAMFLAIGLLRLRRSIQIAGGMALVALLFISGILIFSELPYYKIAQALRKLMGSSTEQQSPKSKKPSSPPPPSQGQSSQKQKPSQGDGEAQMSFQPPPEREDQQRNRPVAIVIFRDDYKPASEIYYFRQQILSQYNGIRMVEAARSDVDRDHSIFFPVPGGRIQIEPSIAKFPHAAELPKPQSDSGKDRPSVTKAPSHSFNAVKTQVSLIQEHKQPFGLLAPRSFLGLPNPNKRVFLRSYEVVSVVSNYELQLTTRFGNPQWPKQIWAHYTQPPDDPRYRELFNTILQPLDATNYGDNPMAKIYTIRKWLEANMSYSMRLSPPEDVRDHVAHFLFESKVGYCVHFSHAAVYLMRLAGIPSRIGQGYAAPVRYRGGGSALLLRSAEAHAWPEIYVSGVGWISYDISPQRNLDRSAQPPDPNQRRLYANLARQMEAPPLPKDLKDPKAKQTARVFPWQSLGNAIRQLLYVFFWGAFYVLALLLIGLYLFKFYRRLAYLLYRGKLKRLTLFYRALEDRLSELAIYRQPGEPLEQFAQRVEHIIPDLYLLIDCINAIKLGSQLPHTLDLSELISNIKHQISAYFPWYRRLLQWPRPLAWANHIIQRWRYYPPPSLQKLRQWQNAAGDFIRRLLPFYKRPQRNSIAGIGLLLLLASAVSSPAHADTKPDSFQMTIFQTYTERQTLSQLERDALDAHRQGKSATTRTISEQILRSDPNAFVAHYLMYFVLHQDEGELIRSLWHLRKARSFHRTAFGATPSRSQHIMLVQMIFLLRQLGREEESLELITLHDRIYPIVKLEDLRPWVLMKMRRYKEAQQLALQFLREKKHISSALNALCAISFEQNKRQDSLRYCLQAYQFDLKSKSTSNRSVHSINLSEAYLSMFDLPQAEKYALEATKYFFPDLHSTPWELLLGLYLEQGRFNDAWNALKQSRRWFHSQAPRLSESVYASSQLSQASFFTTIARPDLALTSLERIRDRPDRHGHMSAESKQFVAAAHLLRRHALLMQAEQIREQAAAYGLSHRFLSWTKVRWLHFKAWRESAALRRKLTDIEFLHKNISPYRSGNFSMPNTSLPQWYISDLIPVVGAGVLAQALRDIRETEAKHTPQIMPFLHTVEAEIAYARSQYDLATQLGSLALRDLPPSLLPPRIRLYAIKGEIARTQHQYPDMRGHFARVMQHDGSVFRRMHLTLPVNPSVPTDALSRKLLDALLRSPRFAKHHQGFSLLIQRESATLYISLAQPDGTILSRIAVNQKPKQIDRDFIAHALQSIHREIFAPPIQLSRQDVFSLDGSPLKTNTPDLKLP